ncbi:MAG TPA: hypothetical protein VL133_07105 [Devosia sp.]|nr:hypothetical protein [Devosia sp.]
MSKLPSILTLLEHRDAGLEVAVICSAGHERVIDYHAENAKFGDYDLRYEWRASQVCPVCGWVGASTMIRQAPPDHV